MQARLLLLIFLPNIEQYYWIRSLFLMCACNNYGNMSKFIIAKLSLFPEIGQRHILDIPAVPLGTFSTCQQQPVYTATETEYLLCHPSPLTCN